MGRKRPDPRWFDHDDMKEMGTIYIVKFDEPIGDLKRRGCHAQWYCGWCKAGTLDQRLKQHKGGYGSRLLRALLYTYDHVLGREVEREKPIGFEVILIQPGTRTDEWRIKDRHGTLEDYVNFQRKMSHQQLNPQYKRGSYSAL